MSTRIEDYPNSKWNQVTIGERLQGKVARLPYEDDYVSLVNLADVIALCFEIAQDTTPTVVSADDAASLLNDLEDAIYKPLVSEEEADKSCVFCEQWFIGNYGKHAPDCLWLRIKAFLGKGKTEDEG